MIREHLRFFLRSFKRHRTHAVLNAAGLALGFATFLLVAIYVHDEWRFDRFHENADRLYRLTGHYTSAEGRRSFARVPPATAHLVRTEVPSIETATRMQRYSGTVIVDGEASQVSSFFFAEPQFLEIFSFPLVSGNPRTALSEPFTAVLTESTASRLFGSTDVLGRDIVINDTLAFTISGIAADAPAHSHLQFNGLFSFSSYRRMVTQVEFDELWTWGTFYSYALLREGARAEETQTAIREAVDRTLGADQLDGTRRDFELQPLTDIHLRSDLRQELSPGGSAAYLATFSVIGLFVLLIAGINFVNLATARASRRGKEVGVRKAVGASRKQLVTQFVLEAISTAVVALVVAVLVVWAVLPLFNQLAGKNLGAEVLLSPGFLLAGFLVAFLTGAASGLYPAAVLAGFRPALVLKGASAAPGGQLLRRGLVVGQFTASIFLIGGTLVALSQVQHLRGYELGIAKEQVVVIPFDWDERAQSRFNAFRSQLLLHPQVEAVTASGDVPGRIFTSMSVWGEGMPEDASAGMNALVVDPDFAEVYGLEVVSGRDFSHEFPSDWDQGFMLNESAAATFGWTANQAVGKQLYMNNPGQVVGVFKDFHYAGVQEAVEPMAFAMWPSWFGYASIRLSEVTDTQILDELEATWSEVLPGRPFSAFFLDQDFDRLYRAEVRFGQVFLVLAVLAILIASLGLYGLAAHTAERRVKEIGIRKALGAGVGSLTGLLSRGFAALVGVAFLVAAPITWLVMDAWLARFAVRIAPSMWSLLAAGGIAVLIAMATVGFHTIRAARSSPTRSLRYE